MTTLIRLVTRESKARNEVTVSFSVKSMPVEVQEAHIQLVKIDANGKMKPCAFNFTANNLWR